MSKVLIACEYSGIVRDAFIAAGHDAISCDLLPTERPGPHIQGDVRDLLCEPWDLVIAHPPCNYLTEYTWCFNNQWRYADWWQRYKEGLHFFWDCLEANAPMVAVENPPNMHPPARAMIRRPDCVTDFRDFGDGVRKRVGWWLKHLPPLMSTLHVPDAEFLVRDRPGSGLAIDKASLAEKFRTAQGRSRFQPGMAAAMAKQWGCFLPA